MLLLYKYNTKNTHLYHLQYFVVFDQQYYICEYKQQLLLFAMVSLRVLTD